MARGGAQPGSGNPGYGRLKFVSEKVGKYSEIWWAELGKMMESKELEAKKFAMAEFNKIQVKMIPQDVTSGGEKIVLSFDSVFNASARETT